MVSNQRYVLINTIQIYHTVNARLSLEKKKGTKCAFVWGGGVGE